jgi:hypothetical protein
MSSRELAHRIMCAGVWLGKSIVCGGFPSEGRPQHDTDEPASVERWWFGFMPLNLSHLTPHRLSPMLLDRGEAIGSVLSLWRRIARNGWRKEAIWCINPSNQVSHPSPVSLPRILCRDGESTGGTLGTPGRYTPPPSSSSGAIFCLDRVVIVGRTLVLKEQRSRGTVSHVRRLIERLTGSTLTRDFPHGEPLWKS